MTEKKQLKPTESELEILQVLWEHGESSVRFVNERLNERRETGYTTTLKLMQIMHERNWVHRNEEARSHLYTAAVPKEQVQSDMLDKFVGSVFGGSAMSLVMQALGNHTASKAELDEIKALIERIEKEG